MNSVLVGKGYFHTCEVYRWKGDWDGEGEEVNYDNLRDDYGDEVHEQLDTEEGGSYVQPHDEFPYETRSFDEWVIDEYGEMSFSSPLLVMSWPRRYADITSDDNWETYYAAEYGGADWGSDETLIYKGEVIPYHHRQKLAEKILFPFTYCAS